MNFFQTRCFAAAMLILPFLPVSAAAADTINLVCHQTLSINAQGETSPCNIACIDVRLTIDFNKKVVYEEVVGGAQGRRGFPLGTGDVSLSWVTFTSDNYKLYNHLDRYTGLMTTDMGTEQLGKIQLKCQRVTRQF